MKKYIRMSFIVILILLVTWITVVTAQNYLEGVIESKFNILYNGNEIELEDAYGNSTNGVLYNDTTYIPLRSVLNSMGKYVVWNEENHSIDIIDECISNISLYYYGYLRGVEFYDDEIGEYYYDTAITEQLTYELNDFDPKLFEYNKESYIIGLPVVSAKTTYPSITTVIKQPTLDDPIAVIDVTDGNSILATYKINFIWKPIKELLEKNKEEGDPMTNIFYSIYNSEVVFYNDDGSYIIMTLSDFQRLENKYDIVYEELSTEEYVKKIVDAVKKENFEKTYLVN